MHRLGRSIAICACAAAALSAPVAQGANGMDTRPAGVLGAGPEQLARGADGSLWLTQYKDPGHVARITADGTLSEFPVPTKDNRPLGIAAGPDGNVWFTLERAGIGRVTPGGVISEFGGLTAGKPTDIAAGPDGNLWFTQRKDPGAIGRITPAGAVTEFTAGLPKDGEPTGIAAGPDGAMWFTLRKAGRIGRVAPDGSITTFPTGMHDGGAPVDIAAGPDGNLWFTAAAAIGRATPAGVVASFATGLRGGHVPKTIVAGVDAMYFTAHGDAVVLGRIGMDGAITDVSVADGGAGVTGLSPGPDGRLWLALRDANLLAAVAPAPAIVALGVDRVDETAATLSASLISGAAPATWYVDYGQTSSSRSQTAPSSVSAGAGAFSQTWQLGGLQSGRVHDARVIARNDLWTVSRAVRFTPGGREQPATPAGGDPADVRPVQGETVVVAPAQGTVRVKPKGSKRFRSLRAGEAVTVGSVVDARTGEVALQSAVRGGATQTATFRAGRFEIRQRAAGGGLTHLKLRGGDFARCGSAGGRASASVTGTASAKKRRKSRRVRRLWASDDHGRYRTHGRDSAATVRGTEWLTVDRCDGTLTRVRSGSVVVRVKATGKRVVVRAGESHLAQRAR